MTSKAAVIAILSVMVTLTSFNLSTSAGETDVVFQANNGKTNYP
jgi:hypothetical protein